MSGLTAGRAAAYAGTGRAGATVLGGYGDTGLVAGAAGILAGGMEAAAGYGFIGGTVAGLATGEGIAAPGGARTTGGGVNIGGASVAGFTATDGPDTGDGEADFGVSSAGAGAGVAAADGFAGAELTGFFGVIEIAGGVAAGALVSTSEDGGAAGSKIGDVPSAMA